MVNTAYDAPIDFPPADADRGRRAAALRAGRDRQVRPGLRALHHCADRTPSTWRRNAYERDGGSVGPRHRLHRSRQQDGRPAALRPDHPRRPSRRWARRRSPPTSPINVAQAYRVRAQTRTATDKTVDGGAWSASSRSKCRPSSSPPASSPSRPSIASEKIRRGMIDAGRVREARRVSPGDAAAAALHRPDGRHLHRPACRARAPAEAPAGARPHRRRLSPAAHRARPARATTACRRSRRSPRA